MAAEVSEPYFSLVARFWAAMAMTTYGTFGAISLYALSGNLDEPVSVPVVAATLILLGSAVSAGFALRGARAGERTSIVVFRLCAPVTVAVVLHWLLVPFSPPSSLTENMWVLYLLWATPSLAAAVSGVVAALAERSWERPKEARPCESIPVPLPIPSSAVAILVHGFIAVLVFALSAGFSTDYMPGRIVVGAVALALPFVFLTVGFSSALARRTERARPILVAGVLSLVVALPALLFVAGGFGLLLYLAAAAPLVWPTTRARRIVRSENAAKGSLVR